jgi:hypothetical protein
MRHAALTHGNCWVTGVFGSGWSSETSVASESSGVA